MAAAVANVTNVIAALANSTNTSKTNGTLPSAAAKTDPANDPITYINIIQVLVPLYLVMAAGWFAGRQNRADAFTLDRLNSFNARIALPGLLFRNIASANLYDADFNIILADLVYKLVLVIFLAPICYFFLPKGDTKKTLTMFLVSHSVMSLPNYVVIGIPVLSAIYTPKAVKLDMGLLLLGQYCIHLTVLAGVMELVLGQRQKKHHKKTVGEHAAGALIELPRTIGHDGFAENVRHRFQHAGSEMHSLLRNVGGRLHHIRDHNDDDDEGSHAAPAEPRLARMETPKDGRHSENRGSGLLREVEEGEEHAEDDSDASIRGISRGYELKSSAESPDDFESNTELCLRILKQRVLSNPMVITATAAIFVSMIVKHKDRNAKLPYIIDQTSLYLNNCVLGVSLFNFGLFAHLNGVVSCEPAEAGLVLLGRFVLSPLMNIPVMYFFGMRGELIKIMIMQATLPQAVSAFVVFKEFQVRADIFSTSMILGTAMCLPATCIWFFALDKIVATM